MSGGVVIAQPGKAIGDTGQPGFGLMPMPEVAVPVGLPPSLAYLAGLNEVRIHQRLEMLEVLTGWEVNNMYTINNAQDQHFMSAEEATSCMKRQCCGACRPFVMTVVDNQGAQLIQMNRPYRCQSSCFWWCCCLQEMEIESPPGMPLAHMEEIWTCCHPMYKIYDSSKQCVFTIRGDCCYVKCVDVAFRVFEGDGEQNEVGQIRKHFSGAREICGMANDFTLNFPAGMDLMKKTILLGATFLIDFNYFEL